MLFRVAIALFVLFNTLQPPTFASAKGGAQVNVATPTQPEVSPVQMPITGTTAQLAIEEPQAGMTAPAFEEPQPGMPAATQPAAEETQPGMPAATQPAEEPHAGMTLPAAEEPQPGMPATTQPADEEFPAQPDMAAGTLPEEPPAPETTHAEMPRVGIMPVTEERMRTGMMQRIWNAMGRPTLTTNDREMLRNVVQQMRGPRRLPRRSGKLAPTMETPGVTTPVPSMPETPMEPQQPTMEQPMTGAETQPAANVPVTEQPMPEPPMRETEEEEATPAASEMSVRGARFNTAVGDIDISNAVIGSEEQRTVPLVALRNVDFNTFVGRLRAGRTEIGRGAEPQWQQTWMPRRREWMPRRREWMPRRITY